MTAWRCKSMSATLRASCRLPLPGRAGIQKLEPPAHLGEGVGRHARIHQLHEIDGAVASITLILLLFLIGLFKPGGVIGLDPRKLGVIGRQRVSLPELLVADDQIEGQQIESTAIKQIAQQTKEAGQKAKELQDVTKKVVETARENLIIGPS